MSSHTHNHTELELCHLFHITCFYNSVLRGIVHIEGVGLGVEKPSKLTEDDDEFEAYRKRMMLAYRFRPNPLVRFFAKYWSFSLSFQYFFLRAF